MTQRTLAKRPNLFLKDSFGLVVASLGLIVFRSPPTVQKVRRVQANARYRSVCSDGRHTIVFTHYGICGVIYALESYRRVAQARSDNRWRSSFGDQLKLLLHRGTKLIPLCHKLSSNSLDVAKRTSCIGLGCIVRICTDLDGCCARTTCE